MKRVIKFRAKSLNHDKWIYARLHGFGMDVFTECVKEDTICQFTGLCDCEGKEIYEGDILSITEYKNEGLPNLEYHEIDVFTLEYLKGVKLKEWSNVVENMGSCTFVGDLYFDTLFGDMRYSQPIFEFRVIGNIYDNKDLLGE